MRAAGFERHRTRPSRLHGTAILAIVTLAAALASAAGCSKGHAGGGTGSVGTTGVSADASLPGDGSPDMDDAAPTEASAFVANSSYSYVGKVKNVLIGLPPTDGEVQSVVTAADPVAQLQTLIKGWMMLADPASTTSPPSTYYEEKMRVFFELATQQTQISVGDFSDEAYPGELDVNATTAARLTQNAIESFARTMVAEVVDGAQPLTQVATTTSFMMTTALMETYAFLDAWQVDDSGSVVDHFAKANPGLKLAVGSAAVPLAESVDPTSTSFMQWSDPDIADGGAYGQIANQGAGCVTDPISYTATGLALHYLLYGSIIARSVDGGKCGQLGGTKDAPQIGNAANGGTNDFGDWRMVAVRQPMAGEATTSFYDLPSLRGSSTLVLNLPRVGFFSTPAFFANWQTNQSNTMRVTMNQTLIVALGAMFDGTDPTTPTPLADGGLPGFDTVHAALPDCAICHRLLDPTRSIFSSTYSWNYHAQDDAGLVSVPGEFAFEGVVTTPQTVFDLAQVLATHPLFASAWAQKLCEYVNSQPCDTTDPEFQRIVGDFTASHFSWSTLVTELLSSPLTTGASPTQTTSAGGEIVAVSRRDHLCAAIDFRFGFTDVCALLPTTTAISSTIAQIAKGLPSDGYGRGAVAPVLPNSPSLFYRAGTENICEALAPLVIDVPSAKQVSTVVWSSADPQTAIQGFVQTVMGLVPSDPRYTQAISILTDHDNAALAVAGITATQALESTFVAACGAPSAIGIGM
jgi:hypothetical protein